MNRRLLLFSIMLTCALAGTVAVQADSAPPLSVQILSSRSLNGTAGDYVTVQGAITNTGNGTLSDVTTYLSLVDNEAKLPVDLEDWSAEKGQYIGAIQAGQTFPLDWRIHFVKAGNYSLVIVAEGRGYELPRTSPITRFAVSSKVNLNPANVLPVAFGTPLVLLFLLFLATQARKVDE